LSEVYKKLENIVKEKYISNSIYVRHAYSRNVDPVLQGVPDIVIRPKDAQEIAEILKIANIENIPVTPRGGGDCEFGGSKPIGDGGIVLDMKRMNEVINLDQENLIVTVGAGISWGKLNEYLCHYGLYTGCMGPGSGMTAAVGGGISHHSVGGGGCAKYGACTNQLVSLEVVLPTGEIIETGSQANKYSKFPFNRFGNGPDLAGLFCGDNGIFGVKTKVSLQIFPRPPFAAYKTFQLPRKERQVSAKIMTEIRQKGIDVYDVMYMMDLIVRIGCEQGMFPFWENLKKKRGVIFYTIEANSEKELEEKGDMEHNEDMQKILNITKSRPIAGSGPILLIDGNNVEITCGFTSFGSYFDGENHEFLKEIDLKLWKSLLERVTKSGVQWYMMGDFMSRLMVDIGAYTPDYYNLMKSIKKDLDPKSIISRGKFNLWGD